MQTRLLFFFLGSLLSVPVTTHALTACPGQSFYLKSGEAVEVEFNRRPGCDVRFVTVKRGIVERKLFYPSGKTDDRKLTAGEGDTPDAWSELPRKAYLKANGETVITFLAEAPPQRAPQKAPREVCPNDVITLSPGEEIVIRWGRRPGCTVTWINYTGSVEEFATYPSSKPTQRTIARGGEFRYPEIPLAMHIKALTPATLTFLAQRPLSLQTAPPRIMQQPQAPQPGPLQTWRLPEQENTSTSRNILNNEILIVSVGGFFFLLILLIRSSSIFVLGHWSKLIENLQASPKDFYASVENAIATREVPAISNSRVDWKEGGLFTARREYLRISREKEVIDICGSPYGTGFFVSWWHGEFRPSAIGPTLVAIIVIFGFYSIFSFFLEFPTSLIATIFALTVIILVIGTLIDRYAGENWITYVLVTPVIGWVIDRLFLPPTYYRIDSASMFQTALNQAVQEVIDQMVQAKGLRALTELERKPILRDFFQRLR